MKKLTLLFALLLLCTWTLDSFAQKVNVTFKVNMKVQAKKKYFNPATDVVTVPGGFNNWLNTPPANTDKQLTGPGTDSIYTRTIQVDANKTYEYKYNIGLGWDGKDELGGKPNRSVVVGATDMVLSVVWFNNEEMPTGANANVTFKADMRLPLKQRDLLLTPTKGKVFAAGDFNGWNTTATELTDADGDSIYTKTEVIKSGQMINYKFLYGDKGGGTKWEDDPNKTAWIVDGNQDVARFYNNVNPNVTLRDGSVNFDVDMSVLQQVGLYFPALDDVQIRGNFNGWSDSDPTKSKLNQNPISPNSYFLNVPFSLYEVNSDIFYKFRLQVKDQTGTLGGDAGYERPLSTGGGNRSFKYLGQNNQNVTPKPYYNDIYPAFTIPAGVKVTAYFEVDMTPAMSATKGTSAFNPATDTVYLFNGQATWAAKMGWKEGQDRGIKFTRKGTTNVYAGSVQITGPSFNGFVYAYEYGKPAPGGMLKEVTGFSNWAWRVRFIPQPYAKTFTQPYTVITDTWTDTEVKTGQYELLPRGLTSAVEDLDLGIPTTFNLEQNYPNPFNPSTTIKFSIPNNELVSLKIYNVLGQEVATLLNKEMKAGSYSVDFNASKLSSGVYIYNIRAGNFNVAKKMLLIK